MQLEEIKRKIAKKAVRLIQDGMTIGLGTGTTAQFFIEELISRYKEGVKFKAIASSVKSEILASKGGIPLIDPKKVASIDLSIDGADEVDPLKQMIKGGGGALLREKIMASMSKEVVIIIDETKQVEKLGKHPLPVEIIPYGCLATKKKLEKLGYHGSWRKNEDRSFFITDNNNYIFDIQFDSPRDNPMHDQKQIRQIPGIVETGFFFNLVQKLIIGYLNGEVKIVG
ncbi:MAG: ribose-5-phosphate isomerase RpiA [Chlamydiae bacterium]|nr:ribose-5-phosphate isomerase RpiA [Chlamydiota bacterium]